MGFLMPASSRDFALGNSAGDQRFWSDRDSYIPFRESQDDWPATLDGILGLILGVLLIPIVTKAIVPVFSMFFPEKKKSAAH